MNVHKKHDGARACDVLRRKHEIDRRDGHSNERNENDERNSKQPHGLYSRGGAIAVHARLVVIRRRRVTLNIGLDVAARRELAWAHFLLLRRRSRREHRQRRRLALEVDGPSGTAFFGRVEGPTTIRAAVGNAHVLARVVHCEGNTALV